MAGCGAVRSRRLTLPARYASLSPAERRAAREQYVREQRGLCFWCRSLLAGPPADRRRVTRSLFPPNFFTHPVHLQHDHRTGATEGAVRAYCNAVMWEYYGR